MSGAEKFAHKRYQYPNANSRWTVEEDKLLSQKFRRGVPIQDLAKEFERTKYAITCRLRHLRLTK